MPLLQDAPPTDIKNLAEPLPKRDRKAEEIAIAMTLSLRSAPAGKSIYFGGTLHSSASIPRTIHVVLYKVAAQHFYTPSS